MVHGQPSLSGMACSFSALLVLLAELSPSSACFGFILFGSLDPNSMALSLPQKLVLVEAANQLLNIAVSSLAYSLS